MRIAERYELLKLLIGNGICPFDEWFKLLPDDYKYMVESRLLRLRLGNFGDAKSVGEGVWELKFKKGPAHRIYYSEIGRQLLLLIVGGDKRSQVKDIKKAKELLALYKKGKLSDERC